MIKKSAIAVALCLAGSVPAFAEQGDPALGLNLGVAPSVSDLSYTNFGLGLKFQYGLTDHLRGEAEFTYWCESNSISAFELAVNFHYMFDVVNRFQMYPIIGLGYGQPRCETNIGKVSYDRFLFNLGVGGEYEFSSHWVGTAELKYQYMKDFSRLPITVGIAYKF